MHLFTVRFMCVKWATYVLWEGMSSLKWRCVKQSKLRIVNVNSDKQDQFVCQTMHNAKQHLSNASGWDLRLNS